MPSGSHSTSGGSHFNGGGSGRSSGSSSHSSSNYSSSSNSSSHDYSPSHYYGNYGGVYYAHTLTSEQKRRIGLSMLYTVLLLTFTILLVVFSVFLGKHSQMVAKCEIDYAYYQAMCEKAYNNPEYQTTARIYDMFYNSLAKKYYVVYKINNKYNGETFAIYTLEEANSLLNTNIPLAINCPFDELNSETDSVPMDYYKMNPTKNGEYKAVLASRNKDIVLVILFALCIAGSITMIVFIEKKLKKSKSKVLASVSTSAESEVEKNWSCEFCGTLIPNTTNKCSSCGATRKKTNKQDKNKENN